MARGAHWRDSSAIERAQLGEHFLACPPTRQVFVNLQQGKPRSFRQTPRPANPTLRGPEAERALFQEAYALWAYADAFDAWDQARPLFEDLKALRRSLEQRGEFVPVYQP